jgi:hypothetical protein
MADVFDGIPIYDHTGARKTLEYFRGRYGPHLTGTWPHHTLKEIRETEGGLTQITHFANAAGEPDVDRPVTYNWPDGPFNGKTNERGEFHWRLGDQTWIAGGGIPTDHAKGPYSLDSGSVHLEGIGWAGGTNHAKPDFFFVGGHSPDPDPGPTPPDPPVQGRIYLTTEEAQLMRAASNTIEQIIIQATNRPPS